MIQVFPSSVQFGTGGDATFWSLSLNASDLSASALCNVWDGVLNPSNAVT